VDGVLREVVDSDLDAFFEHQREPEANRMAAFPARDREAFDAHWRRLLADDSLTKKTIVYEGEVAGNVGCWEQEGRRLVGYWIGREFWGKGLATRALQELTGEVTQRPLHAWVATSNVASIRVLEKCGFVRVGSQKNDVEELLFELRDSPQRSQPDTAARRVRCHRDATGMPTRTRSHRRPAHAAPGHATSLQTARWPSG
jgi:RimJ/RimL family protein N-acetyltransferase